MFWAEALLGAVEALYTHLELDWSFLSCWLLGLKYASILAVKKTRVDVQPGTVAAACCRQQFRRSFKPREDYANCGKDNVELFVRPPDGDAPRPKLSR